MRIPSLFRSFRRGGPLGAVVLLGLGILHPVHAAPGDRDASFGSGGVAEVRYPFSQDHGRAVAAQADGKLLVAGQAQGRSALMRLHPDGAPDVAFGQAGIVILPGTGTLEEGVSAVRVQPDGKILLAGWSGSQGMVARCLADGTLDSGFGPNGVALVTGGTITRLAGIHVNAEGDIIAVGTRYPQQLGVDGSLMIAWLRATGGRSMVGFTEPATAVRLAVQSNGGLLVAASPGLRVFRFLPTGALDTAFGTGGVAEVPESALPDTVRHVTSLAVQPADPVRAEPEKIVLGGWVLTTEAGFPQHFALARFTTQGTLDASFGTQGVVVTPIPSRSRAMANAVLVQRGALNAPTRLLAVGESGPPNGVRLLTVVKYRLNGTLDTAFDGDGIAVSPIDAAEGATSRGVAAVVQSDRLTVAATARSAQSIPGDVAVVRYDVNTGALDTSFDGDGRQRLDASNREEGAETRALTMQADGKILVAGGMTQPSRRAVVARCLADGQPDRSFGNSGLAAALPDNFGEEVAHAVWVQPDGSLLVASSGTHGAASWAALSRLLPDGTLDTTFGINGRAGSSALVTEDFSSPIPFARDVEGRVLVARGRAIFRLLATGASSAPALAITSVTRLGSGHLRLQGLGAPNTAHTLHTSPSLQSGSFEPLGSVTPDASGNWQYDDTAALGLPRRFYRLTQP